MKSIFLYGDIGLDVSVQDLSAQLAEAGTQDVSINVFSYGGDAGQGLAMFNLLERYQGQVTAYIDGVVASAGTLPVMAADRAVMPANALMLIHDCWSGAVGNASSLRRISSTVSLAAIGMPTPGAPSAPRRRLPHG
jgi:ATP-dependent protease ClpP protease subunit